MLTRIEPHLPKNCEVIVQFDSWYAAHKTLKFIHRRKWKITCGVKSNRKLDGMRLDAWHGKEKHKWYYLTKVTNTQKEERFYYVRPLEGRLEKVPFDLCVLISKQHKGQKYPAYFASTRLCSTPTAILQGYTRRWSCESLNFYLKVDLGLSDFRLWHYESVDKYVVAVHLAWAYIERRFVNEQGPEIKCPGDLLRRHREEHAEAWLKAAVLMVHEGATPDQVLQRFLRQTPVVE
jgi:hypothetical protein